MFRVRVMFEWKVALSGNEIQIENAKGEDEQASIRMRKFMMNGQIYPLPLSKVWRSD